MIKIDRNFINNRCKNLKIPEKSEKYQLSSENFQIFTENQVESFLTEYVYTEKSDSEICLKKLKNEFGCHRKLAEDVVQMWKSDLKNGDLVIEVMKSDSGEFFIRE